MPNILCAGPGPHVPASGIIGFIDRGGADQTAAGMVCTSPACQAANLAAQAGKDAQSTNGDALRAKAQAALDANATYLGIASPTAAQNAAQTQRVTKECSALIRLVLNQLDDTGGT